MAKTSPAVKSNAQQVLKNYVAPVTPKNAPGIVPQVYPGSTGAGSNQNVNINNYGGYTAPVYSTTTGKLLSGGVAKQVSSGAFQNVGSSRGQVLGASITAPLYDTSTGRLLSSGSFSNQVTNPTNNLGLNASSVPRASVASSSLEPANAINLPTPTTRDYSLDIPVVQPIAQPLASSEKAITDSTDKRNADYIKSLLDLQDNRETSAESYAKAQRETGILQKQQLVSDLTGELNGIVAKGQAAQLSLTGQGRGIPEAIIGGQQAQIGRETAIAALPVQAQLSAAQGNLEMAEQNLNTLFKIYSDDADRAYTNKKEIFKAVYDFGDAKDKRALDKLDKQEDRNYQATKDLIKSKEAIAIEAAKNGASASTLSKIANATDFASAISSAGSSLVTSSNEITDINGRKALVNKKTGAVKYLDGSGTDITIRKVNGTPVDGYKLIAGDDPYFIAQKYGTDMTGLKALNPSISDWNNIQIGTTINVPSKSVGVNQALQTILGSAKFTKDQKADLINAINNGQDPLTVIKNQAKNIMGQTLATDLDKAEIAKQQLENIDKSLKTYYANGGSTSIFSGNYEKTLNKLGSTTDPKLVGIVTEIALAMQAYRLAVTGTAASVQEDARIDNVFPGITNGEVLNNARTQATIRSFDTKIDAAYRNTLGSAYDDLKANSTPPVDPLQNVNSYGDAHPEVRSTIIQMQNDGLTIEEISNWVNQFK